MFFCSQIIFSQNNFSEEEVWENLKINDSLFYELLSKRKIHEKVFEIQSDSKKYNPPVLFALAHNLFDNNQKDQAVFWYYVGLLRAMKDAQQEQQLFEKNKHSIDLYVEFLGKPIEKYTLQHFSHTQSIVLEACQFVKENPTTYSSAWIFLDGAEKKEDLASFEQFVFKEEREEWMTQKTVEFFKENLNRFISAQSVHVFEKF